MVKLEIEDTIIRFPWLHINVLFDPTPKQSLEASQASCLPYTCRQSVVSCC